MKTLGQLLVWISLAGGVLAAATGYLTSLDLPEEQLLGLTLAVPFPEDRFPEDRAGKVQPPDAAAKPVAGPGPEKEQKITGRLLTELRKADVQNIRVKEFSFRRWRGKWYFLLSMVGLLAGGLLTRGRLKPQRVAQASVAQAGAAPADSPERILKDVQAIIDQLRAELPEMTNRSARLDAVIDRIGQLQKTQMEAFVDARPTLITALGLAGYAVLMSSYATAERQINRAWSAAADGVYEEAAACLDEASTLIAETRRELHST